MTIMPLKLNDNKLDFFLDSGYGEEDYPIGITGLTIEYVYCESNIPIAFVEKKEGFYSLYFKDNIKPATLIGVTVKGIQSILMKL